MECVQPSTHSSSSPAWDGLISGYKSALQCCTTTTSLLCQCYKRLSMDEACTSSKPTCPSLRGAGLQQEQQNDRFRNIATLKRISALICCSCKMAFIAPFVPRENGEELELVAAAPNQQCPKCEKILRFIW